MLIGGKSRAVVAPYPKTSGSSRSAFAATRRKDQNPIGDILKAPWLDLLLLLTRVLLRSAASAAWKQSAGVHDHTDRDCRCAVRTAGQPLGSYPHKEAT